MRDLQELIQENQIMLLLVKFISSFKKERRGDYLGATIQVIPM